MRIAAVVLAAGTSQRFGGRPKQLEALGDSTVLQHAIRAFASVDAISEVWVTVSAQLENPVNALLAEEDVTGVVVGGATRAESTTRALAVLDTAVTHVLVHDAARPLVPRSTVERCVEELERADVVTTYLPVSDTVVVLDASGKRVESMPDRGRVRLHQTPQGFRRDLLEEAWTRWPAAEPATDDVTAVLRAFPEVRASWVAGDWRSLKVTYPEDLAVVRALAGPGRQDPD